MPPTTPKPNGMSTRGRFELPVLAPLDSLTAGTNIPPPEPSPVNETPPAVAEPAKVPVLAEGAPLRGNSVSTSDPANGHSGSSINSPTSPTRPGSIRRFLSKRSLNQTYESGNTNGGADKSGHAGRPESPSTFSTFSSKKSNKRRNSSWFSRILGGADEDKAARKRTSIVVEEREDQNVKKGPPPPQLPQLDQLKANVSEQSLNMDAEKMFGNIR